MTLEDLIKLVAAGDRSALAALFKRTSREMGAIARNRLRSREDAEEVLLDLYVHVWKWSARYDPSRGSACAWLATIVRSRSIDRLRRRRADVFPNNEHHAAFLETLASDALGPEELYRHCQVAEVVNRAIKQLPPVRRQVVNLAFFDGLSHNEIAERIDLPLGTVKSHMRRGLASLRVHVFGLSAQT